MDLESNPETHEETAAFRPMLQRFLQNELAPRAAEWRERRTVDAAVWPVLGDFGMLLPSVPKEYGGLGQSFRLDAAIIEDVEKIVPELNAGIIGHNVIVAHYLLRYGDEAQKRKWLPRLATGELIGAIVMSEPGAGSDLRALRMRAEPRDGGFVLNGQKTFITNGHIANLLVVAVKMAGEADGMSLFVVETDRCDGFRRGRILEKMGLHAAGTSELFFDDAWVEADALLGGEPGVGLRQMMEQLPQERLALSIAAVSAMEHAIDITVPYARERVVFGRPVLDFQANGFTLAEAKTRVRIGRVFVDWCVDRLVEGALDPVTASMAKLWTTDTQMEVIHECVQLHGGYGYMEEYEISRMFTDARAQSIYGGTNEIMKLLIARSL